MAANNTMKSLQVLALFALLVLLSLPGCKKNSETVRQGDLSYNVTDVFGAGSLALELARAASSGDIKEINRLIELGADVNIVGKENITPLWWAAWAKNYKGFAALLDKEADPNAQRAEGLPIMHLIANMEDARFLEVALKHGGNPNLRDSETGETPLFLAVQNDHKQQIELLLGAKADVNIQTSVSRWTVTMVAIAARADYQLAYRLLEAGADPILKDVHGNTLADTIAIRSVNASNNEDPWRKKVLGFLRDKGVTTRNPTNK